MEEVKEGLFVKLEEIKELELVLLLVGRVNVKIDGSV